MKIDLLQPDASVMTGSTLQFADKRAFDAYLLSVDYRLRLVLAAQSRLRLFASDRDRAAAGM